MRCAGITHSSGDCCPSARCRKSRCRPGRSSCAGACGTASRSSVSCLTPRFGMRRPARIRRQCSTRHAKESVSSGAACESAATATIGCSLGLVRHAIAICDPATICGQASAPLRHLQHRRLGQERYLDIREGQWRARTAAGQPAGHGHELVRPACRASESADVIERRVGSRLGGLIGGCGRDRASAPRISPASTNRSRQQRSHWNRSRCRSRLVPYRPVTGSWAVSVR